MGKQPDPVAISHVLEKKGGDWRIVHTHVSSLVKKEDNQLKPIIKKNPAAAGFFLGFNYMKRTMIYCLLVGYLCSLQTYKLPEGFVYIKAISCSVVVCRLVLIQTYKN